MTTRLFTRDGRPILIHDEREVTPLLYSTSRVTERQVGLFRDVGVPLVSFPATADYHLYGLAEPVWQAENRHDHSELGRVAESILRANPDALLLPRVYLCSPPWWDDANESELVVWEDGSRSRLLYHGARKRRVPSLASAAWRAAMADNLRRFIAHVQAQPWGDRVVGYMVNSGNSEEWFHWGTMEGYLFDYNPQAVARFRQWLKVRYQTDEALSAAWGRAVTFDEVGVPDAECRRDLDGLGLRHPVKRRDVIDHGLFFADMTAEVIIELARVVKDATDGERLFGTFFGYLLELVHHPAGVQNGGHLGLRRVLECDEVDFLASPSSYARRLPGDGFSMSMGPSMSIGLHDKVFFHENDIRTHVLFDDAGYGRTETARETCAIQRRELAHALTHGHGMWWYDMTVGWYDDPVVLDALKRIVRVVDRAATISRHGVCEMAVVIDEESMLYCDSPPNQLIQLLSYQCLEMSRAGGPFDIVLADDLDRGPDYKLVVFVNMFAAPRDRRARLHAWLERTGATAIWVVAPGFATDDDLSLDASEHLTGIRLALPDDPHDALVTGEVDGAPFTYGTCYWHGRTPVIDDDRVSILGRFANSGAPALGVRDLGSWRSVYSGAPAVCGSVLRHLAAESGCHPWVRTDDAVYADSGFLFVHARTSGIVELDSPGDDYLFDLENETELRRRDSVFRIYMPRGETAMFYRGTAESWRSPGP